MTIHGFPLERSGPALFRRRLPLVLVVPLFLLTSAASCGEAPLPVGEPAPGRADLPSALPAGTVAVDGSSTVFPVMMRAKESFEALYPDVLVDVRGSAPGSAPSGTGGGFRRFVGGRIDVATASRPMTERERERAELNGVGFIELPIGFDGISLVVHPDNDWIDAITLEELRRLWRPNSSVKTWADLRGGLPARPIALFGPGVDSGTYDTFTEIVVGEARRSRLDFGASENDEKLVEFVLADSDALAFFGYAYVRRHPELHLLAVDAGEGPVHPSPGTIASGRYAPLSRPLFVYVSEKASARPEVDAFVRVLLDVLPDAMAAVGYEPPAAGYSDALLERYERGRRSNERAEVAMTNEPSS